MYTVGVLSSVNFVAKPIEYTVNNETEACNLASRYVSPTSISAISNSDGDISAVYFTENARELVELVFQKGSK